MNNLDTGIAIENTNQFVLMPGQYQLNEVRNKISYPWAPTLILQHNGGSLI